MTQTFFNRKVFSPPTFNQYPETRILYREVRGKVWPEYAVTSLLEWEIFERAEELAQ